MNDIITFGQTRYGRIKHPEIKFPKVEIWAETKKELIERLENETETDNVVAADN